MFAIYTLLSILFILSLLVTIEAVKDGGDDKETGNTTQRTDLMQNPYKKPKGYYSKAETSIRKAKRYLREKKFTDYEEALKAAQKDFTENKRIEKTNENAKRKSLGLPPKRVKDYLEKGRKEYIVTNRVIKMVGHETDLEKIKQAKSIVEKEFRSQKRISSAKSKQKQRKALAEAQNEKIQKTNTNDQK